MIPNPYVQIWGIYKDRKGILWKAVEDFKFGRWLLRRTDKSVTMECTRAHIIDTMEFIEFGSNENAEM